MSRTPGSYGALFFLTGRLTEGRHHTLRGDVIVSAILPGGAGKAAWIYAECSRLKTLLIDLYRLYTDPKDSTIDAS